MSDSNFSPEARSENRAAPRKKRRKKHSGLGMAGKVLGTMLLVLLCTGVILVGFATVYINAVIIPDAQKLDFIGDTSMSLTSTMYYTDENGIEQPYLTLSSDENRTWVSYEDIPEDLVNAAIAIEDKRFWTHNGVDWIRTAKSVINMFTGGSIQGGSTITQQLIKNSTGNNQVTVKRKVTEIFQALEFEKNHSKEQILEWYLNLVYFGERSYGVGAASYAYFGKDVSDLSLAQCASLVGITNNPSRYDPYLNKDKEVTNDAANRKRAKLVLYNMKEQGMIEDDAVYEAACEEVDTMEFVMGSVEGGEVSSIYNWYQEQVITDVVNDLVEEYGWTTEVASHKVYYGGLSIYTNVDQRIQNIVDEVYSDPENLPYVSNSGQQMQSSIVIIDNDGKIVALSGGIGEKTKNRVWNRASATKRPAGSAIKPLAVYAPAVEMGLINPNTIIDDSPYQVLDGNPWPVNAVGYYNGLTTVRQALKTSSNTIAVRVLGDYVTPAVSYKFLEERFHISSLVREKWINNYKYSDMDLAPLALGGLTNGVSLYEMAAAFSVFPSMGRYVPPSTYSKVIDADGTVLLDTTGQSEYVIKETTAYYMNSMMTDVVASGTGSDAKFSGMTIAGKTGTTTSQKDLWFVGYTPYYTAAVWVGYDRQERLGNIGHPQNILWKKVMSKVHEGLDNKAFATPSGAEIVTASYCLDSGKIPTEACELDVRGSRVASGQYIAGDEPTEYCDLHTAVQVCTSDPITDEQTGAATGKYHAAGEFCPEETVKTVAYIDYVREDAAAVATTKDSSALLSTFDAENVCRVHQAAPIVPEDGTDGIFDPNDPDTWPTDDPSFDINDETTWPNQSQDADSSGEDGTHIGNDSDHDAPSDNEPYVPAGIPLN